MDDADLGLRNRTCRRFVELGRAPSAAEATRRIRASAGTHRPWIVAMTANAMEGDRQACLAAGMDDYVSKLIRPGALAAALAAASAAEASA